MAGDTRDTRNESTTVFLAWGMPAEAEGFFGDAALWLTGGVSLLLWTALALVLTSA